jgi:hypothetical protein
MPWRGLLLATASDFFGLVLQLVRGLLALAGDFFGLLLPALAFFVHIFVLVLFGLLPAFRGLLGPLLDFRGLLGALLDILCLFVSSLVCLLACLFVGSRT